MGLRGGVIFLPLSLLTLLPLEGRGVIATGVFFCSGFLVMTMVGDLGVVFMMVFVEKKVGDPGIV